MEVCEDCGAALCACGGCTCEDNACTCVIDDDEDLLDAPEAPDDDEDEF
ncbi:MAG: hypothetical protein O2904_04265 [bacterium]|nr:hypothetical protein [bacterium]